MKTKLIIPSVNGPADLLAPPEYFTQYAIRNTSPVLPVSRHSQRGFTLVELLIVIAVIALLAAMLMPVIGSVMTHALIQRAQGERDQLETAIVGYKNKYGFYPPSNGLGTQYNALTNQLYYELLGTTMTNVPATNFITLDNSSTILASQVASTFDVGGFMNCSQGSGEDVHAAQNFFTNLKLGEIATNASGVFIIVTAVSSDTIYHALPVGMFNTVSGTANPWRYLYPGVNNPNSYDLWLQLVIKGKTNLICNWKDSPQINSSLP